MEKELQQYLEPDAPGGGGGGGGDWEEYKSRLISITAVTQDHFRKLVQELDGGMDALSQRYLNGVSSTPPPPPSPPGNTHSSARSM